MTPKRPAPSDVDSYIGTFPADVQVLLRRVRATVRGAAPDAEEFISYGMPAYRQGGVLVYFAAFKQHIGVYPPVSGDAKLVRDVAPYAGEKGNLRFPYAQPIPYELIARIVKHRLAANLARTKKAPAKATAAARR
jgi:uncharacterized protein YdhG (YjbR/CyaY superfamily)